MSSLADILAETLQAFFGELDAAKDDVARRQQLAEAAGLQSLELPDWLDGAVQALRPGESRAEQLERLLVLVDNFVDFIRASDVEFRDDVEGPLQLTAEVLARLVLPFAMETWRTDHPTLFLVAAILLSLDDRISEFGAGELTYDRYRGVIRGILVAASADASGTRRGAIEIVNVVAALSGALMGVVKWVPLVKQDAWTFDFSYGLEAPTPSPHATDAPVPPGEVGVFDPALHVREAAQRTFSIWKYVRPEPITLDRYDAAPYEPHAPGPRETSLTLAPLVVSATEQFLWMQVNLAKPIDVALSERWRFRLPLESGIGFAIPINNTKIAGGGNGKVRAELVYDGGDAPPEYSAEGVHMSLGSLTLAVFAEAGHAGSASEDLTTGDLGWSLRLERLRFAIPKFNSVDVDIGLRWSHRDGLVLDGGTGLELYIPLHIGNWVGKIFQPTYARLRAEVTSGGETRGLRLAATFGFALGFPGIMLVFDGVGVAGTLTSTNGTGNLFRMGHADSAWVPPAGIGAKIDLGPIEGGGYFAHDAAANRYLGAIDVKLGSRWSLRGFGFVEDRPDGGKSLVAVVNLELDTWSPGFQIDGIGVIVATHRRGDGDALRAALDSGDLDALMFPEDPLRHVPELVGSLNRFFPLAEGVHVFGIALRVSYGLGLVRVRLAGLVQVSNSTVDKLFVAMIAKLVLPEPFEDVLAIELAGIGEYTFGSGPLEVRARLRNSHVAGGELTGGAIVFWGSPGENLGSGVWASLGGYHPRYENVPEKVRVSERIMLAWHKGDDLEASLKMYIALTPGAFHIGAEVSLRATLEGFGIKASLGFDGLVTDDWDFRLELHGEVNILVFDRTLCGIAFRGAFYGHSPTTVDGSAKVSFLFWSKTFPYSKRLTDEKPAGASTNDTGARLRGAFATGWSSDTDEDVVAVKRERADVLVMPHRPVRWEQSILPLATPIDRVGPIRLATPHAYNLEQVAIGAGTSAAPVRAPFPRGQFYDLTDDDKLRGPAFADEVAGAQVRATPAGGDEADAAGDCQEVVVDRGQTERPAPRRFFVVAELVQAGLTLHLDAATWHRAPATPVAIAQVGYRVVGPSGAGPVTTFQDARASRRVMQRLARVVR